MAWRARRRSQTPSTQHLTHGSMATQVKLDVGVGAADVVVMIIVQCILLVVSMGVAWFMLGLLHFDKKLRVMGLFGCTHKTVAMGVHALGVPSCCGVFTSFKRLVSISRWRGSFIFRV